jgi:hypothetical protein
MTDLGMLYFVNFSDKILWSIKSNALRKSNVITRTLESEGQISEITLDVDEVSQCLSYLDIPKATGPDGIPSRLLQACSLEIASSICELFNHSLDTGHIPSEWESANVTAVHKKERIEPAENYRPISLLPILGKVLERCVCLRFYDHIRHLITET